MILIANSLSDLHKDNCFVELKSRVADEKMTTLRGKVNNTSNVNVWDLVVGDIIFMEEGQRVPADCVVIESADLVIDETPNDATDEVNLKTKAPFRSLNYEDHRGQPEAGDPFLRADSMVSRGSCKAVVCCVGENSSRGRDGADQANELNQDTRLQKKLKNLGDQLLLVALLAGAIIFVILLIMTFIEVGVGDAKNKKSVADILFERLPEHINLVVVLIVVCIPEGLPLTVGLSLAFSVKKMFADGILVRKLDAPERLAGCEEILCGKTATITSNEMTVAHFYLEGNQFKNARKDTFFHCELT